MRRRDFLRTAASVAGATSLWAAEARQCGLSLALVVDPDIACASQPGVRWAVSELKKSLQENGFSLRDDGGAQEDGLSIVVSGPTSPSTRAHLERAGIEFPHQAESFAVVETAAGNGRVLIACGADERGVAYALGHMTERLRQPLNQAAARVVKSPANPVRSVMRQFTSELLDKPWFYDREGWQRYLDLLAANRWNRLDLTFGLGYDSLNRVDDSYFLFFYPFVVSVAGYNVYATNLPDSERDRNLETLQFISEQTVSRGLDFQLGLWMHGYRWPAGRARNRIEGLTPDNHAAYCRDALTLVLRDCPAVSSVGLRIHGESGVAEGSYDFWATIFDGVKRCGRTVEIDLHAKGLDDRMIANALATGMPVNVSPKYSAEHFAMPYHQASIREIEMPVPGHVGSGLMSLSEGSRVFTRYGYADLLKENRKYTVRYRVFSGTQRILLSSDPKWTAAYAGAFQFCGATGVDLMEPLTCRGRRGSGVAGTRTGYAEVRLEPKWDWQKYESWYRVWGRLLYDPGEAADMGRSSQLEGALANASRILPLVTNAYLPSAACDAYWPEIYWNQAMAGEPAKNPYGDTFAPKVFQNASPLDPQLFSSMNEFAQELVDGKIGGKYSPVEVAQWLETFAAEAERQVALVPQSEPAASERAMVDIRLQIALGRFFAAKFKAGVFYALYERTNDRLALNECLRNYRAARQFWAEVADLGGRVYTSDLSVSDRFDERGQWRDRLPDMDVDIAALSQKWASAESSKTAAPATEELLKSKPRLRFECQHQAPERFRRGDPVRLVIHVTGPVQVVTATLYYRRVNQAERFQTAAMASDANRFRGQIPAAYTDSPYALQYYFELRTSSTASLFPGFTPELTNQPYYVLRQAHT
jgi:hypothetical protein